MVGHKLGWCCFGVFRHVDAADKRSDWSTSLTLRCAGDVMVLSKKTQPEEQPEFRPCTKIISVNAPHISRV